MWAVTRRAVIRHGLFRYMALVFAEMGGCFYASGRSRPRPRSDSESSDEDDDFGARPSYARAMRFQQAGSRHGGQRDRTHIGSSSLDLID